MRRRYVLLLLARSLLPPRRRIDTARVSLARPAPARPAVPAPWRRSSWISRSPSTSAFSTPPSRRFTAPVPKRRYAFLLRVRSAGVHSFCVIGCRARESGFDCTIVVVRFLGCGPRAVVCFLPAFGFLFYPGCDRAPASGLNPGDLHFLFRCAP